ncbi:MAG: DUF86 domain-containing protein [bacterium]|nr:DUF86 domain-containing protein [bacterium]
MQKDDIIRIQHMLDAARESILFCQNKRRGDLDSDRMLALSLIKSIEIIGEAATKVSGTTRDKYPEVPWTIIVTMRHRLIHGYFDIDLDRVWDTIRNDLPLLIIALEKIVCQEKA